MARADAAPGRRERDCNRDFLELDRSCDREGHRAGFSAVVAALGFTLSALVAAFVRPPRVRLRPALYATGLIASWPLAAYVLATTSHLVYVGVESQAEMLIAAYLVMASVVAIVPYAAAALIVDAPVRVGSALAHPF